VSDDTQMSVHMEDKLESWFQVGLELLKSGLSCGVTE
jgi:hypothetical protein